MSVTNVTFEELQVGQHAEATRVCTADDLVVFAHASGNLNPIHLPDHAGDRAVAPSMWVGSLFSAVIGNILPGVGTLYKSQSLRFHTCRARVGDELTARVSVTGKGPERLATLACQLTNQKGQLVVDGVAEVICPPEKMTLEGIELGPLVVKRHEKYQVVVGRARDLGPTPTAFAYPCDEVSLRGAVEAAEEGLVTPILIGPPDKIRTVAAALGVALDPYDMVPAANATDSAAKAVELVHAGKARMIMKGSLPSADRLKVGDKAQGGLRAGRRISHVFIMDVPGLARPLFVSDAAINIAPDLITKMDITQNAIDLAHALGIAVPKVAVLSAVETVNPAMPSTLDAALLAKMAERGQITGALVDGPLAMDNAIDVGAARTKGIKSMVAGNADILIVPNIESGNMVVKELTFLANADTAGVVVGARVPVVLTSRSDNVVARLASCAAAALYGHFQKTGTPAGVKS